MIYDVQTWYLSVVPVILAYVLSALANARLNAVRQDVGGAIRTRVDLVEIRGAINHNKACAWLYLALWGAQVLALASAGLSGLTTFGGAVGHLFAFGVLTLPGGLWSKSVETKFKAMAVNGSDPSLGETFQRYLVAWKKGTFTIPE
jgi:hypothetical protein